MLAILGPFLLTICAIPMAWTAWKRGDAYYINRLFLWTWFWGDFLTLWHLVLNVGWDWPLAINYTVNFVSVGVVLWYSYRPRRRNGKETR